MWLRTVWSGAARVRSVRQRWQAGGRHERVLARIDGKTTAASRYRADTHLAVGPVSQAVCLPSAARQRHHRPRRATDTPGPATFSFSDAAPAETTANEMHTKRGAPPPEGGQARGSLGLAEEEDRRAGLFLTGRLPGAVPVSNPLERPRRSSLRLGARRGALRVAPLHAPSLSSTRETTRLEP